MEADPNPCRICEEFKRYVRATQQPDSPELLLALTEAGKRSRNWQREEEILKAETLLDRHQSQCPEVLSREGEGDSC